jgi:hypothetical protein
MAWTKRQLVENAFNEIGLAGYVYDLTPDQLQKAMQYIDGMMGMWMAKGISVNWPFNMSPDDADLDTEIELPLYAQLPIWLNGAVHIAASFGKTLSNDTQKNARQHYNTLLALSNHPCERAYPDTLPKGAGNKPWRWNNDPFFPNRTKGNINGV